MATDRRARSFPASHKYGGVDPHRGTKQPPLIMRDTKVKLHSLPEFCCVPEVVVFGVFFFLGLTGVVVIDVALFEVKYAWFCDRNTSTVYVRNSRWVYSSRKFLSFSSVSSCYYSQLSNFRSYFRVLDPNHNVSTYFISYLLLGRLPRDKLYHKEIYCNHLLFLLSIHLRIFRKVSCTLTPAKIPVIHKHRVIIWSTYCFPSRIRQHAYVTRGSSTGFGFDVLLLALDNVTLWRY